MWYNEVMKIVEKCGNLVLQDVCSFELFDTFECGQCFRWRKICENKYFGIAYGKALLIEKQSDSVIFYDTTRKDFDEVWKDYFDFDTDYEGIKNSFSNDDIMVTAMEYGRGIRILRQEPFEALISFIISASNNIPRIKGIVERLCTEFGEKKVYMGEEFYTFPTAERISRLSLEDLATIRAGFRDKYILSAAKAVSCGEILLNDLKTAEYKTAKEELLKLKGVGNKVADCVLLFGLNKYSSFPIDVWVKRIMEYCYFNSEEKTITEIANCAKEHFGEYGGYAQQYLFFWARENKIGT